MMNKYLLKSAINFLFVGVFSVNLLFAQENDPEYQEILLDMRQNMKEWIIRTNDLGLMPEGYMIEKSKHDIQSAEAALRTVTEDCPDFKEKQL